ncbi:MAG: ABC transporter permease, partial [Thermodesulfobacteriota bacterium]
MEESTLRALFWRRFKRNRLAVAGGVVVLLLFVVAIGAPLIAPYDPNAIDVRNILEPPSGSHLFGTDDLGRDILSRVIYGSWVSLLVGFVAVGIATVI